MFKPLTLAAALLAAGPSLLKAGVKTVYMHEGKVQTVPLRMSNSTVFRFDSKPSNVIIGNSNYFQAEFVGNDVSVQPMAEGTTNMFVYSGGRLFTFRLNAYFERAGQDLLIVKHLPKGAKRLRPKRTKQKKLDLAASTKDLRLTATKIIANGNRKTLELRLEHAGGKRLKRKDLNLSFSRAKREIEPLEVQYSKKSKSKVYVRAAFPRHIKPFSVKASLNGQTMKIVITRRSLWVK